MKNIKWTIEHIPLQLERTAVVSGANSGLGFYTSRALALKGAKVIMACRNLEKGEEARQLIIDEGVAVKPEVWHLDLANLESVKQFAQKFDDSAMNLDLLINNPGKQYRPPFWKNPFRRYSLGEGVQ